MKISVQRYRAIDNLRHSLKKRVMSSGSFIPALFIGSLILLACLYVWQRVYVISLVKDVAQLERENSKLKDLVKKANMEIIDLSSLSRIEKIATQELGLQRTSLENVLTLKLDESKTESEGFDEVLASLKKIADNLPILNESRAETGDIFDADEN